MVSILLTNLVQVDSARQRQFFGSGEVRFTSDAVRFTDYDDRHTHMHRGGEYEDMWHSTLSKNLVHITMRRSNRMLMPMHLKTTFSRCCGYMTVVSQRHRLLSCSS
jgi:hypothetical protein